MQNARMLALISTVVILLLPGCGGGGSKSSPSSTPSSPTSPTTTNRAPSITSMEFTPTFGIAHLTTFRYSASATDPEGDPLTYTWDVAGNVSTGPTGTIMFNGGGSGTVKLTVSDSKGASSSDSRSFVCGCMTGTWRGSFSVWTFTSNLTQSGAYITGDYSDQLGAGRLDPAVANTIDVNGNVKLRYKQAYFSDFTFTGTMDQTGRRITGVVNGSGFNNTPFTMNKQ